MTVDEGMRTVTPGRAAQELELRRDEFQLAVQLGLVRTVPAGESGRRRVEQREIDRFKAAPDFPAGLRDRVRAIGTGEAAALLEITPERFTRLVRTGHLNPVRFSLNRYRAVVWTYLAEEVAEFGLLCPELLTGRLPRELRDRLAAGEDLRPRNWRARRLGVQLRATGDPWAKAAAIAALLDPVQVAEVVDDPYERHHLDRLRPPPPPGVPARAESTRDLVERLMRADDPDEILWHRLSLALALDEARGDRQAPHPGEWGVRSGLRSWTDVAPSVPPVRSVPPTPAMPPTAGPSVPPVAAPLSVAPVAVPLSLPSTVASSPAVVPSPAVAVPSPSLSSASRLPDAVASAGVPSIGTAVLVERRPGRSTRGGLLARFRRGKAARGPRRGSRRGRATTWP
ncbi:MULTISPECIES: DUF6397 family protein [unclassified Streptomyces]|uniref:DUF6397 family protein n=1 Tax=unclassified Streptomyces TaxID=2593676 RepID=UPI001660C2DE|nr:MULTISPECIES: DUF6397 family protein [unclassified Streptomyces]MBD0708840.1 hypothetical protein [Streptomyces sp. CBMA291]MBD0717026.1 hypothetical protein [Streptomyces sp. CBMA370]